MDMLTPMSAIGAKLLREQKFYSPRERELLETEWDNIEVFVRTIESRPEKIAKLNTLLMPIKDITGSLKALKSRAPSEIELFEIKAFCRNSDLICEAFDFEGEIKDFELTKLTEVYKLLGKGEGFYLDDSFSAELASVRSELKEVTRDLKKAKGAEREELRLRHTRLNIAASKITEEILTELGQRIAPYADVMRQNLIVIGRMDLCIQKATIAARLNLSRPKIGETLMIKNGVNPMIAEELSREELTFHPISITAGKLTVITGANMGGKTVALKTIVLNCALALMGFFVFAEKMETPLYDDICVSSLDVRVDGRGLSRFATEVKRLDEIYRNSLEGKRLILADEFASGTNAAEGAEIFRAVLTAFKKTQNTVIMTTHFDDVASVADVRYQVKGLGGVSDITFPRLSDAGNILKTISLYMDYGLVKQDGNAPLPRDAIKICKLMGLHPDITDRLK